MLVEYGEKEIEFVIPFRSLKLVRKLIREGWEFTYNEVFKEGNRSDLHTRKTERFHAPEDPIPKSRANEDAGWDYGDYAAVEGHAAGRRKVKLDHL